jgi:hypothetical protein
VAAALSIWGLFILLGVPTIVVPSAAAAVVLVAEAALLIQRLGRVVDGMDASAVPAAD